MDVDVIARLGLAGLAARFEPHSSSVAQSELLPLPELLAVRTAVASLGADLSCLVVTPDVGLCEPGPTPDLESAGRSGEFDGLLARLAEREPFPVSQAVFDAVAHLRERLGPTWFADLPRVDWPESLVEEGGDDEPIDLAPELDPLFTFTKQLISLGIVVSIGHSNASLPEAQHAIAAGATAVTHMFNAMSHMSRRT